MDGIDTIPVVGRSRNGRDRRAADLGGARLTFGWEPAEKLFAEPNLRDLLLEHWEELGVHRAVMPLDPDFDRFVELEGKGLFRIWAARDGGLLVGYVAFFVQPHLHYRRTLHAVEDLFLLSAPYRRGLNGVRLFTTAIEALKELGVERILLHTKVHFQKERGGLEKLFTRLQFVHTDDIWSRHFGEDRPR